MSRRLNRPRTLSPVSLTFPSKKTASAPVCFSRKKAALLLQKGRLFAIKKLLTGFEPVTSSLPRMRSTD